MAIKLLKYDPKKQQRKIEMIWLIILSENLMTKEYNKNCFSNSVGKKHRVVDTFIKLTLSPDFK